MCLYEWISRCERLKKPIRKCKSHSASVIHDLEDTDEPSDSEDDTNSSSRSLLPLLAGHPLADTHGTRCHSVANALVPNFLGATLPRFDQGD